MTTVTRVSVEDFLTGAFPRGAWLVDGDVVVNDPTLLHQEVCRRILLALSGWVEAGAGGLAGYGGNWRVAADSVLKPDVWWVGPERLAGIDLGAATVSSPPDLAVEVRSPGTWGVDVGRKRTLYEQAGSAELWLVDPNARSVVALRRSSAESAGFDAFPEAVGADRLTSPWLPGFALDVSTIFPDV